MVAPSEGFMVVYIAETSSRRLSTLDYTPPPPPQPPTQLPTSSSGMTRESMQPGYDPRLKVQRRVFNPAWSFKDSFGNSRGRNCCTIS